MARTLHPMVLEELEVEAGHSFYTIVTVLSSSTLT